MSFYKQAYRLHPDNGHRNLLTPVRNLEEAMMHAQRGEEKKQFPS
jgi:hypothetical protein